MLQEFSNGFNPSRDYFKGSSALPRRFSYPSCYFTRTAVYVRHCCDLSTFLLIIILINADRIDPNGFFVLQVQVLQSSFEI